MIESGTKDQSRHFGRRMSNRLERKQINVMKRIDIKAEKCGPPFVSSQPAGVAATPIRSVCDLITHNLNDLSSLVAVFNSQCPRDDDFDEKTEKSLNILKDRILQKFSCV